MDHALKMAQGFASRHLRDDRIWRRDALHESPCTSHLQDAHYSDFKILKVIVESGPDTFLSNLQKSRDTGTPRTASPMQTFRVGWQVGHLSESPGDARIFQSWNQGCDDWWEGSRAFTNICAACEERNTVPPGPSNKTIGSPSAHCLCLLPKSFTYSWYAMDSAIITPAKSLFAM